MAKIKIVCRRPGMRRCGQAHPAEAVYEEDFWTDEQLQIFDADPHFEVLVSKLETQNGDPRPQGDALMAAITAEIKKLPLGEKPKVGEISKALGFSISGKELGKAIQAMKAPASK